MPISLPVGPQGGCALTDGIAQDCPIFQADATGIRIRDISPPPPEGYDPFREARGG
jgi:hypothetical protein